MFAGNRLKILRKRKNLTQNDLSDALGFERIYGYKRIGQYEREQRHPKEKVILKLSDMLEVSPTALMIPDIPDYTVLMQLFFAMEDEAGFAIHQKEDSFYFTFDRKSNLYIDLVDQLDAWYEKGQQLEKNKISKEEYDDWRYNFPASFYNDFIQMVENAWAKADELRAKYADYNPFAKEPYDAQKEAEEFQKRAYEYFSRHPENASDEFLANYPELMEKLQNKEKYEKSAYDYFSKYPEDASKEYLEKHPELLEKLQNKDEDEKRAN